MGIYHAELLCSYLVDVIQIHVGINAGLQRVILGTKLLQLLFQTLNAMNLCSHGGLHMQIAHADIKRADMLPASA